MLYHERIQRGPSLDICVVSKDQKAAKERFDRIARLAARSFPLNTLAWRIATLVDGVAMNSCH